VRACRQSVWKSVWKFTPDVDSGHHPEGVCYSHSVRGGELGSLTLRTVAAVSRIVLPILYLWLVSVGRERGGGCEFW
jgi:hypothetical protein